MIPDTNVVFFDQRIAAFFELLREYPQISYCWTDGLTCDLIALGKIFDTLSESNQVMARFFADVWYGDGRMGFDIVQAKYHLSDADRAVIVRWFNNDGCL